MKEDTKIVRAGRHPAQHGGAVNTPVYHVSTVLVDTLEELEGLRQRKPPVMAYGRRGTPTSHAFEEAVAELEGGAGCVSFPSGLAAISGALLTYAETGAHFLISDSAYGPTRRLCDTLLKRLGVTTDYYDPLIGGDIANLIKDNTKIVFTESPGSLTFEVQDIPAIAAAAHERGAKVLMDNTWASPIYFKPFDHGVDLSIQAATKYIVGHSDAMLGTVTANEECLEALQETTYSMGFAAGPDDLYLGTRGIRTIGVRLRQHMESGLNVARWLQSRPEVVRVIHPGLPNDPGHALWQRDFTGASGLFAFVIKSCPRAALEAMVNHFKYFGMGASWGGYESLCMPTSPEKMRTVTTWEPGGQCMRIHVGLEDVDDLIEDLSSAFDRLNAAM
ncbi:MAG: cystathionine beta-lyase [Proteobacteria bacterium]|nr:cystathionine beta-lyase [Pseudomonadota bacterium]MDA1058869.1 cystathionine beta-lyase [Pseudomonadota bacterium]